MLHGYAWFCHQVIRELREEVEKLRLMLKEQAGLGPTGAASGPVNDREVADLMEKLSVSENLMQEMSKTWEQKLAESEKLHQVILSSRLSQWYCTYMCVTIGTSEGTRRHGNISEICWHWCAKG